jgi:ATP-dependent RNA helicase DeaD
MKSQESETAQADGFATLGLRDELVAGLAALGYEEPTPIQRQAIPMLLAGRDLLGMAATGTGKTAAFALPLLERVVNPRMHQFPTSLILVPTRELAMQVAEAVHKYGRTLPGGISVLPIYGGQSFGQQLRGLKRGVDVIVATPGRALDHLNRKTLRIDHVQTVVLDEADEMLDMGFADDLEAILSATPAERQTALFSATMPPRITEIARRHLKNPAELRLPHERVAHAAKARIRQIAYMVPRPHKLTALSRVLDMESPTSALVFCRTRIEVDELTERLNSHGYIASALHGGMDQTQRDRVMDKFRSGKSELLIATDVAARGLDIRQLSHVINYDVPPNPESYVHRIGRTGRAGAEGVAITIAEPREHRLLRNIEQAIQGKIEISSLPTVADLQARRLELLQSAVEEILRQGELHQFRVAVESLGREFDLIDVAAAALKLAQNARGDDREDEQEIAVEERPRGRRSESRAHQQPTTHRDKRDRERAGSNKIDFKRGSDQSSSKSMSPRDALSQLNTTLHIGMGKKNGLTATDIVTTFVKNTGLKPKAITNIEIDERSALVNVPTDSVKKVISTIREIGLKGKKTGIKVHRPEP